MQATETRDETQLTYPATSGTDLTPTELAGRINHHHRAATAAAQTAIEHAIRCGELLAEAKQQLPHGAFLQWLREHCEVKERQAQNYMRVARNRELIGKNAPGADLTIKGALALLDQSESVSEPREVEKPKKKPEPKTKYDEGAELEERISTIDHLAWRVVFSGHTDALWFFKSELERILSATNKEIEKLSTPEVEAVVDSNKWLDEMLEKIRAMSETAGSKALKHFGLNQQSSVDELNAIFRKRSATAHPDAGGDVAEYQELAQYFSDAKKVLNTTPTGELRHGEASDAHQI